MPVVLAITLHEAAHGYAALALGDDTARLAGRLSLNPLRHVDRVGTILLPGFLLIFRTINSPFGEVLKAIRENEPRAISLGYKTDQYKLLAFILSGTLAGFAGSLKVFVAQNASLTDVHWSMSGEVVLMTLVGGLGTVFGPVVGAFVIVGLPDRACAEARQRVRAGHLVQGVVERTHVRIDLLVERARQEPQPLAGFNRLLRALELDRRKVRDRIAELRQELAAGVREHSRFSPVNQTVSFTNGSARS